MMTAPYLLLKWPSKQIIINRVLFTRNMFIITTHMSSCLDHHHPGAISNTSINHVASDVKNGELYKLKILPVLASSILLSSSFTFHIKMPLILRTAKMSTFNLIPLTWVIALVHWSIVVCSVPTSTIALSTSTWQAIKAVMQWTDVTLKMSNLKVYWSEIYTL